jgi:hypothetical protein
VEPAGKVHDRGSQRRRRFEQGAEGSDQSDVEGTVPDAISDEDQVVAGGRASWVGASACSSDFDALSRARKTHCKSGEIDSPHVWPTTVQRSRKKGCEAKASSTVWRVSSNATGSS